jgi:nitrate/nitrite transporter NarK
MLAQGMLFGIGSALVFFPAITIPGQWFSKHRALAMGIVGSSSGLGGTIWPIAIDRMIRQIGMYAHITHCTSATAIASMIIQLT